MKKMAGKFIARKIGYPLQDLVKHTSILKKKEFLMETQKWDESRLREYQFSKLKSLLQFSMRHVPYYRDLFIKEKIDLNDITRIEDIKIIPVLTKEIVRNENMRLMADIPLKHIKKGKTGGTTGSPVMTLHDAEARSFTWGSYYRWYDWIGVELGDPVATLWGSKRVLRQSRFQNAKDRMADYLQNTITINAFQLDPQALPAVVKKLNRFEPVLIKGYLSALYLLANHLSSQNKSLDFKPLAVSTTSETLLKPYKDFMQNVFQCPVYDQYGCGEVEAIAYECREQNGLHITSEHVIVEVLNPDNDAVFNTEGKIVVTDLDNQAMPFIRYENGDMAALDPAKCRCGLQHPLLKSIAGRSIETIILKNGGKVHGVFFTDIFHELDISTVQVSRFQVHQKIPGAIELRLEVKDINDDAYLLKLKNALMQYFNDAQIIKYRELAADESGKFRYVLSEVKDR
jgi:phenylacetate-CoA ligase